ncbi:lipase 3-like isoform X2 [Sitodiplosis mosellana]|uniref:lipase 3-like isoform X2 n=1 Tax=Sitodiplosis mosellana TaxID=263140 RepID=UPI0024445160|nr:lipase 3-like isoform X2 [Sitodiplosis mosellana]
MQTTEVRFVVLFLFLYSGVEAKFRECGEFDPNGIVARTIKEDLKVLPFQDELKKIFDAFDKNDNERMEEAYKSLENIEINDVEDYAADVIKFVPDRIKSEGYPSEVHQVQTDDGYKLQLHRIPYGKNSPKTDKPRPPVYLMHGFMDSSNGWIVLGPENSLVWMGNARGTEPSREHVRLKPNGLKQKEFWSFSWHEIGVSDLPASIDYILNETKFEKLSYVGFSQGTTSFFVLTSMRPEYNNKIIEANLLAPVALLKGHNSPLYSVIAHFYKPLKKVFEILRIYKLTISNKLLLKISEVACKKTVHSTPFACNLVLSLLDSSQINCTSLPFILVNTPAGAALRQGIHYIQLIRDGGFRQFDYEDKKVNQKIYGSDTPPPYNLTQINVPVHFIHSKDDNTASFENVMQMKTMLPNLKSTYLVPIADFSHVDFIYSRYLRKVNDHIIRNINKSNLK